MDNKIFGERLREKYRERFRNGTGQAIRAPESRHILLSGTDDHLIIRLDDQAANESNMQETAGAFDAWLLAVRHWLGVRRFEIDLVGTTELRPGHGGRTWYRLLTLKRLLGDELRFGPSLSQALAAWAEVTEIWLNVADKGRDSKIPTMLMSESDYELALCYDPRLSAELAQGFGLQQSRAGEHWKLCRQFPVGMFDRDPYQGAWRKIGTKGKSAIDLVGLSTDNVFHLFELKKPKAIAIGALSELLFYTSLLNGVRVASRPQVRFGSRRPDPGARVSAEDLLNSDAIMGHLLVPDVHPLLVPELFAEISGLAVTAGMKFGLSVHRLEGKLPSIASFPAMKA